MHKDLHPRDDIDFKCQEKKERREFARIEGSINKSIRRLEDYIQKSKERRITAT